MVGSLCHIKSLGPIALICRALTQVRDRIKVYSNIQHCPVVLFMQFLCFRYETIDIVALFGKMPDSLRWLGHAEQINIYQMLLTDVCMGFL